MEAHVSIMGTSKVDVEDLVSIWKNFSLLEEEAVLVLGIKQGKKGFESSTEFMILGKLITISPFNLLAMCRMMQKIRRTV